MSGADSHYRPGGFWHFREDEVPRAHKEGERKSARDLYLMCDSWRADWNEVNKASDGDIKDALGAISYLRNQEEDWWSANEPMTYDMVGHFPNFGDYVRQASTINLVKMARIYRLDMRLFNLWIQGLPGRRARGSINGMVGKEAEKLCDVLANWHISPMERTRLHRLHDERGGKDAIHMDVCVQWSQEGRCRRGDECKYLHATRGATQ